MHWKNRIKKLFRILLLLPITLRHLLFVETYVYFSRDGVAPDSDNGHKVVGVERTRQIYFKM
jgi:hypothetical protein